MCWKKYTGGWGGWWCPDLIGYIHRQREGSTADLGLLRRKKALYRRGSMEESVSMIVGEPSEGGEAGFLAS